MRHVGRCFNYGPRPRPRAAPADVARSLRLDEHTDEILRQVLGFGDQQVAEIPPPARPIRRRSKLQTERAPP